MKLFTVLLLLVIGVAATSAALSWPPEENLVQEAESFIVSSDLPDDEDSDLDAPELIKKYGYPCEKHSVTTEDRYVLTMFRIPYGRNSSYKAGRPVVYLQHGLMNSADDWVILGPEKSFAYILADAGYDVWLGNARGNWYSQKHLDLRSDDPLFWKFSWHENGIYDVTAQIDHIINSTSQQKIFYVGHSMGTTMFYVAMSRRPEYNEKIRAMFSLAPIAYMNHMFSPFLQLLSQFQQPVGVIASLIGTSKFTPNQELLKMLNQPLCKKQAINQALCYNPMFMICGFDSQELDKDKLAAILAHVPAGSSVGQFFHYAQGIDKGHFRMYDFDVLTNHQLYGSSSPPDYQLSKVTAPVALFFSENDWLAGLPDIDRLYLELGNAVRKFKIKLDKFNHIDFVWAKSAKYYVYDHVMKMMEEY